MSRWFSWQALASCLSSAGLGLMLWLGISVAMLQGRGGDMVLLRHVQHLGLVMACVLCLFGFAGLRASAAGVIIAARWRRASAIALVFTLALAVATIVLLTRKPVSPGWVAMTSGLLGVSAIATILSAGMFTATSGRTGWRQQMVAPNFLGYALLAGATLLFALLAIKWPGQGLLAAPAPSLIMLAVVMAALKALYWFENGGLRAPIAGFAPADALRARLAVLALLTLLPLVLAMFLFLWPQLAPRLGWCVITASILAGGCLERRLLGAEAGIR
ncbi:MAG TPA: hypothetical protein VET30_11400 [Pseudoxanthomonas sp.]|nr:hypothetical protein [Pseudoxanthomonas sp.]